MGGKPRPSGIKRTVSGGIKRNYIRLEPDWERMRAWFRYHWLSFPLAVRNENREWVWLGETAPDVKRGK